MRNCFYISGSSLWKSYAGDYENRLVLNESARLNLKYMSLHASQYSKLNSRNVLPYDEMVCYKRLFTGSDSTSLVKLILSPKQRAKPAASRTRTSINAAVCIASLPVLTSGGE